MDSVTELLEEAKRHFDVVVIDTAPVLQVADTMLLAPQVDTVLFSIRRDVSRFSNVSAAVQRLELLGVSIMGAVAIGIGLESLYRGHNGYGYRHPRTYGANPVAK
jgi:Mrp family chromosome partitioning ATPase